MAGGLSETVSYRDARGQLGRTSFFLDSRNTPIEGYTAQFIANDISALSNAAFQSAKGPWTSDAAAVVYGTTEEFPDVEDKAILTFSTATGALHKISVPAPVSTMFYVDGETVDIEDPAVQQLVADVTFTTYMGTPPTTGVAYALVSRDGNPLTMFIGGQRVRRRFQRKLTIYTKDPTESEPDEG